MEEKEYLTLITNETVYELWSLTITLITLVVLRLILTVHYGVLKLTEQFLIKVMKSDIKIVGLYVYSLSRQRMVCTNFKHHLRHISFNYYKTICTLLGKKFHLFGSLWYHMKF